MFLLITFIGYPKKFKQLENQITLKYLGDRKQKGLNRIAKVDQGHLCLREENPSFNNNYII